MARVLVMDGRYPAAAAVAEAVALLRAGRLVAFPTETVYGLGARAFDPQALARVFAAKGRPTHHPLIAHVETETQARALSAVWPEAASRLAGAMWPGPLTLVVERAAHVPSGIAGGQDSIALRVPSHPVARALIAALGEPIAAPSANRYQGLSPTTAAHVVKQLGDTVDLVVDGGACDAGIESTVVDVRFGGARLLRPGAADLALLRRLVPDLTTDVVTPPVAAGRASPGMDARHYAPRARLVIAATAAEAWAAAHRLATDRGLSAGLVLHDTNVSAGRGGAADVRLRRLPAEPAAYARAFYGTLHELDDDGVVAIVVQAVPPGDAWSAVADRLRRGSTAAE